MEKKTDNRPKWWKPAIESPAGASCLCCPSTTELLRLDTKLYGNYAGWNIVKNGQEFFCDNRDVDWNEYKDLAHVEELIGDDNENEYIANFVSGLRGATYQRHAKNTWVLIGTDEGYA